MSPLSSQRSPLEEEIRQRLFAMQEVGYQAFQQKLLPTLPPETVIGVRVPALRRLAKELAARPDADDFLRALPHATYEENCLHGFLLERIRDYDACVKALDAFLPYVDNWATCDMTRPKALRKDRTRLLTDIRRWLDSDQPYTVRFGMEQLMTEFLDEAFQPEYLAWVGEVRSEEYYVNMMIAWYFATALAKQYEAALPWIAEHRLPLWVHNKSIQKAVESFRVSEEHKTQLRALRRK